MLPTIVYKKLRLKKSPLHRLGVFADEDISKDEAILRLGGRIISTSTEYSLQIDEKKHLSRSGLIDDYLNHSCDPNCYIDFETLELKALRDISAGEELTFHYCTAEEELKVPFKCRCGSSNCLGEVKGFRYLNTLTKERLFPYLSPFLKERFISELSSGALLKVNAPSISSLFHKKLRTIKSKKTKKACG